MRSIVLDIEEILLSIKKLGITAIIV